MLPLKFAVIAVILIAKVAGIVLPLVGQNRRCHRIDEYLSIIAKAFAADMILATGFVHKSPDGSLALTDRCLCMCCLGPTPMPVYDSASDSSIGVSPVPIPLANRKDLVPFVKRIASLVPNLHVVVVNSLLRNLCKDDQKLEQVVLGREFHISLGRIVPIRVHQIDSVVTMLRQKL